MKKKIAVLLFTLTITAAFLTACGNNRRNETATQPITATQETPAQSNPDVSVKTAGSQASDAPLPEAGESVPISGSTDAAVSESASGQTSYLSEEEVKKLVVEHAGVKEEDISYFHMKLDSDDGIIEYEVEFYVSNVEYEYDLDAVTGAIHSFNKDMKHSRRNTANASGTDQTAPVSPSAAGALSEEEAKQIALEQVPGAADSDLRISTDYDDGLLKYEVKIVYNQMKYDFEIDANTGTILEWESESIFD